MIEALVRAQLLSDPTVFGLVATRIYPSMLPQAVTLPAISYFRVSTGRLLSHDGPSGLEHPLLQLDMWAESYDVAKALAAAVREALDGFASSGELRGAFLSDERDIPEDTPGLVHLIGEYFVWAAEAA
jgi:hypothetical protein